mgnify:CR=1 FL=1
MNKNKTNKMIFIAKAQIIGGIVPNLIAFGLFLGLLLFFSPIAVQAEEV